MLKVGGRERVANFNISKSDRSLLAHHTNGCLDRHGNSHYHML